MVFVNPKDTIDNDLAYETAGYFRYNELFANPIYGQLQDLDAYLNALITRGTAGNATNIGRNYSALELKGVIKIVQGTSSQLYRMLLLKKEVLNDAKEILSGGSNVLRQFIEPPQELQSPLLFRIKQTENIAAKKELALKKLLRDEA